MSKKKVIIEAEEDGEKGWIQVDEDSVEAKVREAEQNKDVAVTETLSDDELQKQLKKFLVPKLRSASYRWAERSKAIKAARKSRGIYECAMCLSDLKNGEFIVDHKEPVVPLDGWDGKDWTMYITRMFCHSNNFQIICKPCSTVKTDTEVQIRKLRREAKKKLNKS